MQREGPGKRQDCLRAAKGRCSGPGAQRQSMWGYPQRPQPVLGGRRPACEEPTQPGLQTRGENKSKRTAPNKPASLLREVINKRTEAHAGPGLLITRAPLLPPRNQPVITMAEKAQGSGRRGASTSGLGAGPLSLLWGHKGAPHSPWQDAVNPWALPRPHPPLGGARPTAPQPLSRGPGLCPGHPAQTSPPPQRPFLPPGDDSVRTRADCDKPRPSATKSPSACGPGG